VPECGSTSDFPSALFLSSSLDWAEEGEAGVGCCCAKAGRAASKSVNMILPNCASRDCRLLFILVSVSPGLKTRSKQCSSCQDMWVTLSLIPSRRRKSSGACSKYLTVKPRVGAGPATCYSCRGERALDLQVYFQPPCARFKHLSQRGLRLTVNYGVRRNRSGVK
jgi:hypothetical protein